MWVTKKPPLPGKSKLFKQRYVYFLNTNENIKWLLWNCNSFFINLSHVTLLGRLGNRFAVVHKMFQFFLDPSTSVSLCRFCSSLKYVHFDDFYLFLFLRLEQPYLNANASFFEALSCCSRLQRFCLISRSGTFDPSATEAFVEKCSELIMCHMFMGGTLVACRTLQKTLFERWTAWFLDHK